MKKNSCKGKSKTNHNTSLMKQISKTHSGCEAYDKKNLEKLLNYLKRIKKKKRDDKQKEYCQGKETSEVRTDTQVKLRCRQLPNVVQELRKAILRQDWHEAVTLLIILCHPGLKLYTSIILRTCCILLFSHMNSNTKLLQDFVRLITGYILEEDVSKFTKILFALRKSAVTVSGIGKYIRKTNDYKVTRDFEFESL